VSALRPSGRAYERARECLRVARVHLADCRPSLWAQKVREAAAWRDEARRLREYERESDTEGAEDAFHGMGARW
jgi:hypothetical protein